MSLRIAFVYDTVAYGAHRPQIDWSDVDSYGLTGTDLICVKYAAALARRGHEVTVYCHGVTAGTSKSAMHGRDYEVMPLESLDVDVADGHFDVAIAVSSPTLLAKFPATTLRMVNRQVAKFSAPDVLPGFQEHVDVFLCPSATAADHVKEGLGCDDKFEVLPNGCDPDHFGKESKVPGRVVYCSSPDRGLHLLLSVWPEIKRRVSEAHLKVFYYSLQSWLEHHTNPENDRHVVTTLGRECRKRAQYIKHALPRLAHLGVEVVGGVSHREMERELDRAMCLAYPVDTLAFTETFSVATLEACAAGALPVISSCDALGGIYGGALGENVIEHPVRERMGEFVERVVYTLKGHAAETAYRAKLLAREYSWDKLTVRLEEIIERHATLKSGGGKPVLVRDASHDDMPQQRCACGAWALDGYKDCEGCQSERALAKHEAERDRLHFAADLAHMESRLAATGKLIAEFAEQAKKDYGPPPPDKGGQPQGQWRRADTYEWCTARENQRCRDHGPFTEPTDKGRIGGWCFETPIDSPKVEKLCERCAHARGYAPPPNHGWCACGMLYGLGGGYGAHKQSGQCTAKDLDVYVAPKEPAKPQAVESECVRVHSTRKPVIHLVLDRYGSGPEPIDLDNPSGDSGGGCRAGFVGLAKALGARGDYDVVAYSNWKASSTGQAPADWCHPGVGGVRWKHIESFSPFEKRDALLAYYNTQPLVGVTGCLRIASHHTFVLPWPAAQEWTDVNVAPSGDAMTKLRDVYDTTAPWYVLPNAVGDMPIPEGTQRVPGRVIYHTSPSRGLHHLVEMWPEIKRRVPHATLHIVGDVKGWVKTFEGRKCRQGERAHRLREALGRNVYVMDGEIKLLGKLPRKDLLRELGEASCFAFPCDTITPCETFSVSVMECLKIGLPVVLRPRDSLRSIYEDYVVRRHDMSLFAEAVADVLLNEGGIADDFARLGTQLAAKFTFEASANALHEILQKHLPATSKHTNGTTHATAHATL